MKANQEERNIAITALVPTIALGDYVKAPVTPQSENDMPSRKGIVTKINVPEQEIEPFKQYAKTITERID